MSAVLLPQGKQQYFTAAGVPLVGGKVFTYDTGTSNPRTTWADAAQTAPNANPVILDARGEAPIFWSGAYRVVIQDSLGNAIWTMDGVADLLRADLASTTDATKGAALIGFNPALAYPAGSIGAFLVSIYGRSTAEIAAGVTPTNYNFFEFNLLRYGADRTGVASSTAAQAQLNSVLAASAFGADIVVPPGAYLFSTQPTWNPKDAIRSRINAYGAIFKGSGAAISTMRIAGGTTNGGFDICGLQFDNHGDAGATYGAEVVGTSRTRWYGCHWRFGGNAAGFSPGISRNSNPADVNTGSFWSLHADCSFRRLVGGDGAIPATNWIFQGAANAAQIRGGEWGDATNPVLFKPEAAQTYISNGVLIHGPAIEGYTYAVLSNQNAAVAQSGLRIIDCRLEPEATPGNALLSLQGSAVQPVHPVILSGNYWTPDQVNYTINPNSQYVYSLDSGSSGAIGPTLDSWKPFTYKNRSGNLGAADFQTGLDGTGIVLREDAGTTVWTLRSTATGGAEIFGNGSNSISMQGVAAISNTGTFAKNLRGNDAFVGAALTRTITFAAAEPDATYFVLVTPMSDWGAQTKPPWITAKGTGGFTVNAQATTTSGAFDWAIIR